MRIYSVTFPGGDRILWTNYQSAAQSYSFYDRRSPQGGKPTLEAINIPDEAWKRVDKLTESRLNRIQTLWEQLSASDAAGLDALLDDLVKRVQPPVLKDEEKSEAHKLLEQLR